MANVIYYVALPFTRAADDEVVAGEVQERQTSSAAVSAERPVGRHPGAVAFSRTGDPASLKTLS